jgi:hypothetical protein
LLWFGRTVNASEKVIMETQFSNQVRKVMDLIVAAASL